MYLQRYKLYAKTNLAVSLIKDERSYRSKYRDMYKGLKYFIIKYEFNINIIFILVGIDATEAGKAAGDIIKIQ